ncbi:MAG TPA: LamG domain-containing protein [Polyangia bacterium]|nr:LamG domain-containing protein [Polyangia bacterium]
MTLRSSTRLWAALALPILVGCGGNGLSSMGLGDGGGDAGSAATSLRQGLVGAWSFDGDGRDHSANMLDLDVTGLRFGAAKFGKGIQFGGDATPIAQRKMSDPELNVAMADFTVSFWIDFAMTGSAQFVALKGYGDTGWFVGWAETAWGYGLPKGGTFVPPGGSPSDGMFHHVLFQRSGDMVQLWVDGTSLGTATAVAGAPSTDPFQVGGYAPGGVTADRGQSVVDGVVDDLAIWRRALVADEVTYLDAHAVP